jgi:hypothetical protein
MNIVYVAHPYRGDEAENRERVGEIMRELNKDFPEVLFLSPIHAFGWLGDDHDRALALCRRLLAMADEIWLFGDWRHSEGCLMERDEAKKLGIEICAPMRLM